jgi:hypothetical protein
MSTNMIKSINMITTVQNAHVSRFVTYVMQSQRLNTHMIEFIC